MYIQYTAKQCLRFGHLHFFGKDVCSRLLDIFKIRGFFDIELYVLAPTFKLCDSEQVT